MKPSAVPQRLSYLSLDIWRGLASLLVVLYHTAGVQTYHHPELAQQPYLQALHYGSFGVSLFFVISGFCIANAAVVSLSRDPGVVPFFRARLRRIFPPYWCAFFLYVALILLTRFLYERHLVPGNGFLSTEFGSFNPWLYLLNLTLTHYAVQQPSILPVNWTLCYELAFYLLVGLFLVLFGKKGGADGLLRGLHLLTLVSLLSSVFMITYSAYPFNRWPQFGFGVLVYDLLARPAHRETRLWSALVGVASVLALWRLNAPTPDPEVQRFNQEIQLSLLIAGSYAVLLVLLHRADARIAASPWLRWLGIVGGFSYSLYLTHFYILRVVLQLWEKFPLRDPSGVLGLLFGTLGSVAFAALFYRFCEQPFLKKRAPRAPTTP